MAAQETRLSEEQWLAAHDLRVAVRLDLRRRHEVVADLTGVLAAHPYQERLASTLPRRRLGRSPGRFWPT